MALVIGLTGRNASGKGQIAEYFKNKGFKFYSLSDVIRDEARKRGLQCTRDVMVSIGIELRSKYGTGYLADRTIKNIEINSDYVIDSFRHPNEVNVFRRISNFNLLVIKSDQLIRFERIKLRNRIGDPKTYHEFLVLDNYESSNQSNVGQQLDEVENMANCTIENNGTIEELYSKLGNL
jgi:dephospho-CoA kinase